MHKVGLPSLYSIGEVYGFDEELLAFLPQPIYATIVCYERLQKDKDRQLGTTDDNGAVKFYMKQTNSLDNACGVIACIHAALNTTDVVATLPPESILGRFASETKDSSPMERCIALENNSDFKSTHRGYASRGQTKEIRSDQSSVKHHFVAYVLSSDQPTKLLELDGTKRGPLVVGDDCNDVLRGSIAEIQRKLREGEISQSLSMMTLQMNA